MNINKKSKKAVKPGSNIVRVSRLESIKPININTNNYNITKSIYNPSFALLASYLLIIFLMLGCSKQTWNYEEKQLFLIDCADVGGTTIICACILNCLENELYSKLKLYSKINCIVN